MGNGMSDRCKSYLRQVVRVGRGLLGLWVCFPDRSRFNLVPAAGERLVARTAAAQAGSRAWGSWRRAARMSALLNENVRRDSAPRDEIY